MTRATLTGGPRDGLTVELPWDTAPPAIFVTDEQSQQLIDEAEENGQQLPDEEKTLMATVAYELVDSETDAVGEVFALYRHTTDICQCDHPKG